MSLRVNIEDAGYELIESLGEGRHILSKIGEIEHEEWVEKPDVEGSTLMHNGKALKFVKSFHSANCLCNACVGHIG